MAPRRRALLAVALLAVAPVFVPPLRFSEKQSRVPRRVIDDLTRPLDRDGDGVVTIEDVKNASPWSVVTESGKYKEADRKARHVVFGYPDWVKQRSPDRYLRNLTTTFVSRVVRGIWFEVLFTMLVAAVICFFYDADFVGFAQALALPDNLVQIAAGVVASRTGLVISTLPFTLTATLLSLLLVFKTNSAYGRWWEARQVWGSVTNKCRDLSRQIVARMSNEEEELKVRTVKLVVSFPWCLRYHLGEKTDAETKELQEKLESLLPPMTTELIMSATHKPMTVCGLISDGIHSANLDVVDEMKMDNVLSAFSDYYGMCERIFKTPMPIQYTRLTARFLSIWLLLLPFALHSQLDPHWLVVPVTGLIAFFGFAIEDLSVQLEEPFSIQPLKAQSEGIQGSVFEALELEGLLGETASKPAPKKAKVLVNA